MTFSWRPVAANRWIALTMGALFLADVAPLHAQSWQGWWPGQGQQQYRQQQPAPPPQGTPSQRNPAQGSTQRQPTRNQSDQSAERTPRPQATRPTEPQVAVASP